MDFVVVYIEEAHPTDGWMYPAVQHHMRQPVALPERVRGACIVQQEVQKLAASCSADVRVPVFVDTMANTASTTFGALPERLVVVLDGVVQMIGGKGPESYSVVEAAACLDALLEA